MKLLSSFLLVILFQNISSGQVTWANGAAEVVFNNCTSCHNPLGIAPFSLLSYNVASENSLALLEVVESGEMPPWTADSEYQSYAHDRQLTLEEKQILLDWIEDGAQQGPIEDVPPPPVYDNAGFILTTPDLEVQIPTYTSTASENFDDYVCFSLPLDLSSNKKLRAFEVIPGNPNIVHHCLIYTDPTGTYETNTEGLCTGPTDGLLGGYTPGSFPTIFPSDGEDINMGITIDAGSNLVLAMHYPEGSAGEVDSTKVRLYFYDDEVDIREISTDPIIQNWSFQLPANEFTEVEADFNFIPTQISVLSTFPHMHLLGESIKSFAVTPDNDTIPFVNIPHWDFEWQEFLFFSEVQVVPSSSTIFGEGEYNNTTDNDHNPNDPPIDVFPGLNTTDEMFLIYFHYLPYEAGDELLNLEEMTELPVSIQTESNTPFSLFETYPNPFEREITFEFSLEITSKVSLFIYNQQGQLVEKVLDRDMIQRGEQQVHWLAKNNLSPGLYYYSIMIEGVAYSGKIIKR